MFEQFLKHFPPAEDCTALNQSYLAEYESILPDELTGLYTSTGTGKYGKGLIEIIRPGTFTGTLETWLGKKTPDYLPVAISAFGYLYYYRKLTEEDDDVCELNPHYRSINTIAESVVESIDGFFNNYLTSDETRTKALKSDLFEAAHRKHGLLKPGEIYCFVPALCLGGSESAESLNAEVHLDLLFQAGL